MTGSVTIACPYCGKPALCSPSKGIWCDHCKNGSIKKEQNIMTTIWKYNLRPGCTVDMPKGAKLLHVAEQNDDVCLWAQVDPLAPLEARRFAILGTGHDMPDYFKMEYIGTALMRNLNLVFHVYEVFSNSLV